MAVRGLAERGPMGLSEDRIVQRTGGQKGRCDVGSPPRFCV